MSGSYSFSPRHRAAILWVALSLFGMGAYAAISGKGEIERVGATVQVQASALLEAEGSSVARTLVEYGRPPEFVPIVSLSKTFQRERDKAVVQQKGRACIEPFKMDFTLSPDAREEPINAVFARA